MDTTATVIAYVGSGAEPPVQSRKRLKKTTEEEEILQDTVTKQQAQNKQADYVEEWIAALGSPHHQRKRRRRSWHHQRSETMSSSPKSVKSQSNMGSPPFPLSVSGSGPRPAQSTYPTSISGSIRTTSTSAVRAVEDPLYPLVLERNGIIVSDLTNPFPGDVQDMIEMAYEDLSLPLDEFDQDVWNVRYAAKSVVEGYYNSNVLGTTTLPSSIKFVPRLPMTRHAVPSLAPDFRVSNPIPDGVFGYLIESFTPEQRMGLLKVGTDLAANSTGMFFPFLVVEYKGDGPTGADSVWVASNQLLGGSSTSSKLVDTLNKRLKTCEQTRMSTSPVNEKIFGATINGREANLFVTWKRDDLEQYVTQQIDIFSMPDPQDYVRFVKIMRNIIKWGATDRLREVGKALEDLLKAGRKQASAVAKARLHSSQASSSSHGSGSSSRGGCKRSKR